MDTHVMCICVALTANPTGDAVASAQGLVSRLLGPAAVPLFTFNVIPATPGPGGFSYDTYEIFAAGAVWPIVYFNHPCASPRVVQAMAHPFN